MSSVGETLRRERLRTGLDLERISEDTKISVRMLELIEGDRFDKLPGGVFAKSFVRQYARAVGADEEELVRELERTLEPEPAPLPRAEEIARAQPEFRMPRVPQFGGAASRLRPSSSLPALALVVLVIMACSAAYTWWTRPRQAPSAPAPAPVRTAQTAEKKPEPAPPAAAPAEAEPSPPLSVPSVPAAQTEAGALTIALTAEEPTWVRATANGKVVFSGILQPNETKSLSAAETMTLRVGNAGGVAISLNGKSIPALGPKGQVRTVQLSPDGGVQVVAPEKVQPHQPAATDQTQSL